VDFGLLWGVARVGIGCGLVWAIARRWEPAVAGTSGRAERGLVVALLAAWLVTMVITALGALGQLGADRLLVTMVALFLVTRGLRVERPEPLLARPGAQHTQLLWPLVLVAPIVLWDLGVRLPAPPTDWDALTYHLYLPVRWLQAEGLFHVPTVFGDPAAAFAPQNGALLFTWWIALLGGDALTNVVNVLPAAVLALALARLGMRCGLTGENAALSGLALFWVGPMRSAIFEARVDMPMLAFWGASLVFVVHALDRSRPTLWLGAGLASGLAAGTKVVGLALVAPQAIGLAALLLFRREPRACAGFLAACIVGGGWWFVLNVVYFGNPLFPLHLQLGELEVLRGAIPFDVLAGQFHAPLHGLVGKVLPHYYGWAAMGFSALGLLVLLLAAGVSGSHRAARLVVAGIAVYWTFFYFFRLPHNTETRFLLPVVALALLGIGQLLEPLQRRSAWLLRVVWALCFVALCVDVERLPQWREGLAGALDAGVPVALWVPLCVLTGAALLAALFVRSTLIVRASAAAGLVGLAASVALAQQLSLDGRVVHHRKSRFHDWAASVEHLDLLDLAHSKRVAYTGFNLPYMLTGPRLTRSVRYVNTQGQLDAGFYDFWKREPRLAKQQKPGLYRGGGRDDYGEWIRNLEAAEIDWLLVLRLHPRERSVAADARGFPVERAWAVEHPRRFERIASEPAFELYGFHPAPVPAQAPSAPAVLPLRP
jgi:hypothetical protein